MTINDNLSTFAGLPVKDYAEGASVTGDVAWRLRVEYEAEVPWPELFESFVEAPGALNVEAFVVGSWGDVATGTDSAEVVEALVGARERLLKLTAIFLGDLVMEESEISWIHQSDVSPLFSAYPKLTTVGVRGGNGLSLGRLHHAELRTLVIESGGLDVSVVRQVGGAVLPKLEHLELWLGTESYGANWRFEDLAPILSGTQFPALKTLALRDSDKADDVAKAVASSPLLERLQVLDLSLGTLTDEGAEALLASPSVRRLKRLVLNHHYMSEAMVGRLEGLGIEVDVSDRQDAPTSDDRYVAVSE